MTYVAVNVSHLARRTQAPVRTRYRAVTCSARKIAIKINDTVGSSTHAANQASDHTGLPAEANP